MDDATGEWIGNSIGVYDRTDDLLSGSGLSSYLRIRVGLYVNRPLRRFVSVCFPGEKGVTCVELDYEKLPHFCFFCGRVTHTGPNCEERKAGRVTKELYDDLLCSEKKEKWLLE